MTARLLVAVVVAACAASACQAIGGSGSLAAEVPIRLCVPDRPAGSVMTIGVTLHNRGSQKATIRRVAWYGTTHLDLTEAVVLSAGAPLIGALPGTPQAAVRSYPATRHDRLTPAAAASVPAGRYRPLLLGTRATAAVGTADGVNIWYEQGGNSFWLHVRTRTILTEHGSC